MKRIILEINNEIKEILNTNKIPLHNGICYLMCLYYSIEPDYIPENLKRKILALNIVTKDYSNNELIWRIPLFENTEVGFEWVEEWMDMFRKVNPSRKGVKKDVLARMKKFFANNPSVRKEDVFKCTEIYLKTIRDSIYCKMSHKFIYEIDGTSMLYNYLQQYYEGIKDKDIISQSDII